MRGVMPRADSLQRVVVAGRGEEGAAQGMVMIHGGAVGTAGTSTGQQTQSEVRCMPLGVHTYLAWLVVVLV